MFDVGCLMKKLIIDVVFLIYLKLLHAILDE
jgi:hypothetical protein